jgi:purine-binding chemotaxis protein CheW
LAEKQQFSSFFVDGIFFGVEVAKVQEVISGSEITPVPMSHLAVRGLINLRGQIVTVIDLRRCLELAERPTGQLFVNLIVYTDDGCVSLLVDQVGDVLSVDEDQFEYPPATLQGRSRDLIRGAYKLEGKLMLVLDTDKVVEATSGSVEKDGHGSVPAANKRASIA